MDVVIFTSHDDDDDIIQICLAAKTRKVRKISLLDTFLIRAPPQAHSHVAFIKYGMPR